MLAFSSPAHSRTLPVFQEFILFPRKHLAHRFEASHSHFIDIELEATYLKGILLLVSTEL